MALSLLQLVYYGYTSLPSPSDTFQHNSIAERHIELTLQIFIVTKLGV